MGFFQFLFAVDNVVQYTMPEAVWMLQGFGRSPFFPHPTHSHSSGLGNSIRVVAGPGGTLASHSAVARERNALLHTCCFPYRQGREMRKIRTYMSVSRDSQCSFNTNSFHCPHWQPSESASMPVFVFTETLVNE